MKMDTAEAVLVFSALCQLAWLGHVSAETAGDFLAPCPDSPNCVSSLSGQAARYIAPITYTGSMAVARHRLIAVLGGMKRTKILATEGRYLHAVCRSAVFRFVDDLQWYFDDEKKIIHVRSASRLGYYDFGVNRRRVEKIRADFAALSSGR